MSLPIEPVDVDLVTDHQYGQVPFVDLPSVVVVFVVLACPVASFVVVVAAAVVVEGEVVVEYEDPAFVEHTFVVVVVVVLQMPAVAAAFVPACTKKTLNLNHEQLCDNNSLLFFLRKFLNN